MSETHTITGAPRGEPRSEGEVGARLRIPLSGSPSQQWSRGLGAHLMAALNGHEAVGHLRLNNVVQGADIVLEGVTAPHASALAPALVDAVEETNRCAEQGDQRPQAPRNMGQEEANRIAAELRGLLEPQTVRV
jgi:hypothetical protein